MFLYQILIDINQSYFRITTYPVINNINTSSNSEKPPSLEINEQQQSRHKSKTPPIEQHSKLSDRRSR